MLSLVLHVSSQTPYSAASAAFEHVSRLSRLTEFSVRTSEIQVDGTHQSPIASVSQWSDDQAATVPQVLIAIQCHSIDHFHNKSISWWHATWWRLVMLPVVPTGTLWIRNRGGAGAKDSTHLILIYCTHIEVHILE